MGAVITDRFYIRLFYTLTAAGKRRLPTEWAEFERLVGTIQRMLQLP